MSIEFGKMATKIVLAKINYEHPASQVCIRLVIFKTLPIKNLTSFLLYGNNN